MCPHTLIRTEQPDYHAFVQEKLDKNGVVLLCELNEKVFAIVICDGAEDHAGYLAYHQDDSDLFDEQKGRIFNKWIKQYKLDYYWINCYSVAISYTDSWKRTSKK